MEYAEPGIAIGNIHNRNKARLDKFSRGNQIDLPYGGTQEVVLYSFKGLLEVCRYSNQPKADVVMDWLLEVADEIRLKGRSHRSGSGYFQRRRTQCTSAVHLYTTMKHGTGSQTTKICYKRRLNL